MDSLPNELIVHITGFLSPASLLTLRRVASWVAEAIGQPSADVFEVVSELVECGREGDLAHMLAWTPRANEQRIILRDWIFYETMRLGRRDILTRLEDGGHMKNYCPGSHVLAEVAKFVDEADFRPLTLRYHPAWNDRFWIFNFGARQLEHLVLAGYMSVIAQNNLNVKTFEILCRHGRLDLIRGLKITRRLMGDLEDLTSYALESGHLDIIEYCLAQGPEISDDLYLAALRSQSMPVFERLLKYGPPRDPVYLASYALYTDFAEVYHLLLPNGQPSPLNQNGPIFPNSFRRFSSRIYNYIMEHRPDLWQPPAFDIGSICQCLMWGDDLDLFAKMYALCTPYGKSSMASYAIANRKLPYLQYIVDHEGGSIPLKKAAKAGYAEAVEWLAKERGADLTPLQGRNLYPGPDKYSFADLAALRSVWRVSSMIASLEKK